MYSFVSRSTFCSGLPPRLLRQATMRSRCWWLMASRHALTRSFLSVNISYRVRFEIPSVCAISSTRTARMPFRAMSSRVMRMISSLVAPRFIIFPP